MNRREEHLDRFIDQLNAGQRPSIPEGADREFVSIATTMQHLHRTRQALTAVPRLREPQHQPANRLAAAALALTLVTVLGIMALALRGSSTSDDTPTEVAIGAVATVTAAASPAVTVIVPANDASPAWTADLQPIGDAQISGGIMLLPTGSNEYELSVLARRVDGQNSMTWTLTHGACATLPAHPAGDGNNLLRHVPAAGEFTVFTLNLPESWMQRPLALIAEDSLNGEHQACVDLPVADARDRQPAPDAQPLTIRIEPEPGRDINLEARAWTTRSGDVLLRIEATGPAAEMNFMWHVGTGSCQALRDPILRYTVPRQGLYRTDRVVGEPGRYALSLILAREWLEQPLTITAYGNGGGPLAACGDVPATLLSAE